LQDRPVQTNKLKGAFFHHLGKHTTDACHGNVKHGRKDPHRGWKDAARRFHDTRQLGEGWHRDFAGSATRGGAQPWEENNNSFQNVLVYGL